MSTVTPRRAEILEESSSRRELFCLLWDGVSYSLNEGEKSWSFNVPFSLIGFGHIVAEVK